MPAHRADVPDGPVEVRHVQPYQAVKVYRCPGCDHEIPPAFYFGAGRDEFELLAVLIDGSNAHVGATKVYTNGKTIRFNHFRLELDEDKVGIVIRKQFESGDRVIGSSGEVKNSDLSALWRRQDFMLSSKTKLCACVISLHPIALSLALRTIVRSPSAQNDSLNASLAS